MNNALLVLCASLCFGLTCRSRDLSHARGHLKVISTYTILFLSAATLAAGIFDIGRPDWMLSIVVILGNIYLLMTWRTRNQAIKEAFVLVRMFFIVEAWAVVALVLALLSLVYFLKLN